MDGVIYSIDVIDLVVYQLYDFAILLTENIYINILTLFIYHLLNKISNLVLVFVLLFYFYHFYFHHIFYHVWNAEECCEETNKISRSNLK